MSFYSDPPTPRTEGRTFGSTMARLILGMPLHDPNRPRKLATFYRSGPAVERRPSLNPCLYWPGWIKLSWRLCLIPGIILIIFTDPFGLNFPQIFGVGLMALGAIMYRVWFGMRMLIAGTGVATGFSPFATFAQTYGWAWGGRFLGLWLCVLAFCIWGLAYYNYNGFSRKTRMPLKASYNSELTGDPKIIPFAQTHGQRVVTANFWIDPHLVVSGRTGMGKTVFLMNLIVWVRRHGGRLTLLDPKRLSFINLRGVDGISVNTQITEMVQAIHEFHESMQRTYAYAETHNGKMPDGNVHRFLIIDEFGEAQEMIRQWWKDQGFPGTPAPLVQIQTCLRLGRQADHHCVIGLHQASSKVIGSTEQREQYGHRLALGPQTPESWRAMFGGEPRMRVRKKRGRGLYWVGDEFSEVQVIHITEEAALAVLQSLPTLPVHGHSTNMPSPADMPPLSMDTPTLQEVWIVGQRDAAEFLGMSYEAFVKARMRYPLPAEQREGKNVLWRTDTLTRWRDSQKGSGR